MGRGFVHQVHRGCNKDPRSRAKLSHAQTEKDMLDAQRGSNLCSGCHALLPFLR